MKHAPNAKDKETARSDVGRSDVGRKLFQEEKSGDRKVLRKRKPRCAEAQSSQQTSDLNLPVADGALVSAGFVSSRVNQLRGALYMERKI